MIRRRRHGARPDPGRSWSGLGRLLGLLLIFTTSNVPPATAQPSQTKEFPEVVRVRVPASRITSYFPPGTQLRGMELPEFEELLRRASEGARQQVDRVRPGLIRAQHQVRWEDGILLGRSHLVLSGDGSTPIVLEPWNAWIDPAESEVEVASLPDGRSAIVVGDAAQAARSITWKRASRSGNGGRTFDLALPDLEVSSLLLDLPVGLRPEGVPGIGHGPEEGSDPTRRTWRFDGASGRFTLSLRAREDQGGIVPRTPAWVRGPVRVEILEASANWEADWIIDLAPHAPQRLEVLLDPGLELVGVTGPDVLRFQSSRDSPDGPLRLSVEFSGVEAGSTRLLIEALARVPAVGPWTVPSLRPVEAGWTGGRTTVWVGPARDLDSFRPLHGRTVAPRAEERDLATVGGRLLVFEGLEPGPAAELSFRPPTVSASAEVRGRLELGHEAPRIDATVTWTFNRGPILDLPIDLPSGWTPERVVIDGLDEPTAWRQEWRPDGGARVVVQSPPYLERAGPIVVRLAAVRSGGRAEEVRAPRVRPVGARLSDELWMAVAERGVDLRPIEFRGVAWVDSALVAREDSRPEGAGDRLESIAWRCVDPDGEVSFTLATPSPPVFGYCWVVAEVRADRLAVDWYLDLEVPERASRNLTVIVSEPTAEAPELTLAGDAVGPPLPARPAPHGLVPGGAAWVIELPQAIANDRHLSLHARTVRPWEGRGMIPLISLPEPSHSGGTALVWVDPRLRAEPSGEALRLTDREAARRAFEKAMTTESGTPTLRGRRLDAAFAFDARLGTLALSTEALTSSEGTGVIREARLSTRSGVEGRSSHRLTLIVQPGTERRLDVRLPPDASLERGLRDGKPLTPQLEGRSLVLTLSPPGPIRSACEIVLDYSTPVPPAYSSRRDAVAWPEFSMECLASVCEFELSRDREVTAVEPGFRSTELQIADALGPAPSILEIPSHAEDPEPALADLEARAPRKGWSGATLGDWLTRLDSGKRPIVVDRLALASRGYGPRSRPPALGSEGGTESLARTLTAMGLRIIPIGSMVLLSTEESSDDLIQTQIQSGSDAHEAWSRILGTAVARGSDETDRFQTVSRWRGEFTPETPVPEQAGWLAGSESSRWVRVREPIGPISLEWSSPTAELSLAVSAFLAIVLAGSLGRRFPAWIQGLGMSLAVGLGLIAVAIGPRTTTLVALGSLAGSLVVLGSWLGRALRRGRESRSRPGRGIATIAILVPSGAALLLTACSKLVADVPDRLNPILVLLPYDEGTTPLESPRRVVLRLADYERLSAIGNPVVERGLSPMTLAGARHEFRRAGPSDSVVAISEYEIRSGEPGTHRWAFPLGNGRDVTCERDGRSIPVRIEKDGTSASVPIDGPGSNRIRIRRLVAVDAEGRLRLPVVPVATATLSLTGFGDAEVESSLGPVEPGQGRVEAKLGPASTIVLTRSSPTDRRKSFESVEGLLLWDLEPAGDRLRTRLTVRRGGGDATLRLELEPGLQVSSASFDGWEDAWWEGSPEHPVWVARVSPPPADGDVLSLEFWRPRPQSSGGVAELRRAPRVVPRDVEAHSGLMAVRTSPIWQSSFEPMPITSPVLEDLFLRAWGPLPEDRGAIDGAMNWLDAPGIAARLTPRDPHPTLRPSMRLEIGPGRIDVRLDMQCLEPTGRLNALEVGIPDDLRVSRVEGQGLIDWTRPSSNRLVLRFDDTESVDRSLRIQGWLGMSSPSAPNDAATRERPLPWFTWPGASVEPGSLMIVAPPTIPFRVDERSGLSTVRPPTPDETGALQAVYRSTVPEPRGVLRWLAESPRASVAIWSHLTVDPDTIEWTARVHYEVSGGPIREIRLELPPEWADRVRLESETGEVEWDVLREGEKAILAVRPDPPVWSARDLLIRGMLPIDSRVIRYPSLVPLGNGKITNYLLAWLDRSGQSPVEEGTAGIQEVAPERFDPDLLPIPRLGDRRVHQVLSGGWSLRLRLPATPKAATPGRTSRSVASLDAECTLGDSGEVVGLSRFQLVPGEEPFLVLRIPEGLRSCSALLDGQSVGTFRDESGALLVPVGDAVDATIELLWSGELVGSNLVLPTPIRTEGPVLITIFAPETLTPVSKHRTILPTQYETVQAEQLERLAANVQDSAIRLDRSSARDRSALVARLLRFEVRSRAVVRMLTWPAPGEPSLGPGLREGLASRVQAASNTLAQSLREAGLEELLRSARTLAGSSADEENPGEGSATMAGELPSEARLRRIGRPRSFRGALTAGSTPIAFRCSRTTTQPTWRSSSAWSSLGIATLLVALAAMANRWAGRPVWLGALLAIPWSILTFAFALALPALVLVTVSIATGWIRQPRTSQS